MRIAVIGGGHGCYAAAADLSEQGHEVRLWRRDAAALEPVRASGSIGLIDAAGTRRVPVARITADIGEAVRGAELLLMPSPAPAQDDIAGLLAPHLSDGQVAFLPPGTFGTVVSARRVAAAGSKADVLWAETGTLPYLARKQAPDVVRITTRAVRLPTGVYPARRADEALAVIARAYPSVLPCGDALSGALMNAGPIIHTPLILLNAAPLQHFERWDIHNEGTQPAVRAVTDALDRERVAVREALGYGAPHFPLQDHYTGKPWMYPEKSRDNLTDSGDWREHIDLHTHRYMTEDVEYGLAFLASVARWAGVDAPITAGLLAVAGGILGRDLRGGPRTLEAMGLADTDPAALKRRLREGTL